MRAVTAPSFYASPPTHPYIRPNNHPCTHPYTYTPPPSSPQPTSPSSLPYILTQHILYTYPHSPSSHPLHTHHSRCSRLQMDDSLRELQLRSASTTVRLLKNKGSSQMAQCMALPELPMRTSGALSQPTTFASTSSPALTILFAPDLFPHKQLEKPTPDCSCVHRVCVKPPPSAPNPLGQAIASPLVHSCWRVGVRNVSLP